MGIHDSSLTRVRPALVSLGRRPEGWVEALVALGSRARDIQLPNEEGWCGRLQRQPAFEHPADAPMDYLRWLLDHPHALDRGRLATQRGETLRARRALLDGDADAKAQAVRRLSAPGGAAAGRGQWHVFEGTTMVDCALFCENLTLFIEGKRTERYLTGTTEWYARRHQVVRNLDCLRVARQRAGRWLVLTIVEEASTAEEDARAFDNDSGAFRAAVPHLSEVDAAELRGHYLGWTSWQRLRARFALPAFPDTITDPWPT